jgi:sensor histidine kinase YesM
MNIFAKVHLRTKIISLVIAICIFALLGMSVACYITIKKMSEYLARTNTAIGDGAADSASDVFIERAHNFLLIIARQQSVNCNAMLDAFKFDVELLEGVVITIFNNPQYLPSWPPGSETAVGYQRIMNGETGFFTVEENGGQFFIAFSPISVTVWSVGVTVNKDELLSALGMLSTRMASLTGEAKKNIERMLNQAIMTFIGIFNAVAVMVVFLSVFIKSIISKPIQKLTEEVVKIGAGHLNIRIEGNYNVEFDRIKDAVNSMAADIKVYMEGKLQAERKLAESRISIMLSQIQPHFLYNALAVISRLCDKDPAQAKEATKSFSDYLRGNMNLLERTKTIPFETELNHRLFESGKSHVWQCAKSKI